MESAITERGVTRRFRRIPEALPAARAFVRRWLPVAEPADALVLGAAEAMNNVVNHATGESFTVAVDLDCTAATVVVADGGPGFDVPPEPEVPAADETCNRGLVIMHALVDEVDIAPSPDGTVVTLRQPFAPVGARSPTADAAAVA